jgi:hypothetical protein
LNIANTDQHIAEQAQFTGLWLDEELLRDEFDAIIAASWPAEQPTRTTGRAYLLLYRLRPRCRRPLGHAATKRPASKGGGRDVDQSSRERSPPRGDPAKGRPPERLSEFGRQTRLELMLS